MTKKITDLTAIPSIDRTTDVVEVVDVSANTSYKATVNNLLGFTGGNPTSTTDTQTLTNKTITSPAISNPVLSGTVTGTYTLGGTPTFPAAVVTLTGSQTLTNKILTSPTINTATIVNPTLTVDAVTGFSDNDSGTVYGITVTNGVIQGTVLADGGVQPKNLQTGTGTSWATTTITPSKTGWSSTTRNVWQYIQVGKMVWLYFDVAGTSNSTSTSVTLPIAARSISATNSFEGSYGLGIDNTSTVVTQPRWSISISVSTTLCTFFTSYAGGGWTASGTKQITGYIIYEAA